MGDLLAAARLDVSRVHEEVLKFTLPEIDILRPNEVHPMQPSFKLLTVVFISLSTFGQTNSKPPSLSETLEWLTGASDKESGDGNNHITFETSGKDGCAVVITETRANAGRAFWIKESFSLADIDPSDVSLHDLSQGPEGKVFAGKYAVRFHTTNYRKKIGSTSSDNPDVILTSDYSVFTNESFAPRFAKAFRRAVTLCGGKPSSY